MQPRVKHIGGKLVFSHIIAIKNVSQKPCMGGFGEKGICPGESCLSTQDYSLKIHITSVKSVTLFRTELCL